MPFNLGNSGNSILSNTYHKPILESNGDVDAPTTVIFKGEKSVTLKPGFSVDAGSVFMAITQDCPDLGASFANFSSNSANKMVSTNSNLVEDNQKNVIKYGPYSEYEVVDLNEQQKIQLKFKGKAEFGVKGELFHSNGNPLAFNPVSELVGSTQDILSIDASNLINGEYMLRIFREGRVFIHKIVVTEN